MRAEPTPILSSTPHPDNGEMDDGWTFHPLLSQIQQTFRLAYSLSRLVRPVNIDSTTNLPQTFDSRYGNVYAAQQTPSADSYDSHVEERFIEELIISMDETLIEAVERIIAQSGSASKTSSVCSSRSASQKPHERRERSNSLAPEDDSRVPERS